MKKWSSTIFAALMSSACIYAHAGGYDRWLQTKTSMLACSSMVIPVMVILGLLLLLLLKNSRINNYTYRLCTAIVKYEILSTVLFWILLSLFITPFYSLLSATSHDGVLVIIMFATWVLCFFKWARKCCTNASLNLFLLIMAVSQAIGYCAYSVVVKYDFFQQLFRYTDAEYQLADFYLYPEIDGISICCNNIYDVLLVFAFPFVVCLIYAMIDARRRKRQLA